MVRSSHVDDPSGRVNTEPYRPVSSSSAPSVAPAYTVPPLTAIAPYETVPSIGRLPLTGVHTV